LPQSLAQRLLIPSVVDPQIAISKGNLFIGKSHDPFQSFKRTGLTFEDDDVAALDTVVSEPSQQRIPKGVAMLNRRFILGENRSTAAWTRCRSFGIPCVDGELIDSLTDTAGDE
jgi:hypothetical protein